jgi:hypothetical protein
MRMIPTNAIRIARCANLESHMAEFEEQLGTEPESSSLRPLERAVRHGVALAKSAEMRHFPTLSDTA